ncbi:MAG: TRAP transporter substrate-binding protein DctP [Deltaproteobacteria bacterium]|nr:MAG: TRAP transporter substrate-binding protein DctP [Deltaproteobacteria bacterium]
MNCRAKKTGVGLLVAFVIIFVSFTNPMIPQAMGVTRNQIPGVISTGLKLLWKGQKPTKEHSQKIKEINRIIKAGEISKEEIHQAVKEQVFLDIEKYTINRYQFGEIFKRAPELLPEVTGEDLHKMVWEKAKVMLKETLYLKIGTLAPEGTAWLEVPRKVLNPHLKKVSGGKVVIKLYTGGVMGEDVDIIRKMDLGQLDGCGCTALGVFKASPEIAIFTLPLLFRNYDEVDHILKKFRKEIDAGFEKKGYVLASLIDTGWFYLWMKNEAATLEEIRNQKMMTWFGAVETTTYDELGIRPTPISVPEVVTSLNTGLVNATYGPAAWILGTQAYTNLNYFITQPLFYSPAAIFISEKIQVKYRGEYSDILVDNFRELLIYEMLTIERTWIDDYLRPYENKCIEAFKKYGIKPITLGEKDMETFEAASKKVWEKLTDKIYTKDFLDRVLKELESYRSKKP